MSTRAKQWAKRLLSFTCAGVSARKIFVEMKILTWNINGIRAAGRGRSMKDILDSLEADVTCLQETKVTRE